MWFLPETPSRPHDSDARIMVLEYHRPRRNPVVMNMGKQYGFINQMPPKNAILAQNIELPVVVQEWPVQKNPLGYALRKLWHDHPQRPVIVECVLDNRGRWIPIRIRTDKTRCNAARTVRFAEKATSVYRSCGFRNMILRALCVATT